MLEFIKLEQINLRNHPEFNEKWLQDRIAEDPSLLGLGDVILKDRERRHPRAGRLDLLLQDAEATRRYEVEIQLGKTDEAHIIRTVEYWDIERKRYPQYEHCAVIVAEDITSRFLNIISLFNGAIPLIAIQVRAVRVGSQVSLFFTTVVDEMSRGFDDEEDELEPTDRGYWEGRGSKETMGLVDNVLSMIHTFAPGYEPKYNKFYIGLVKNGQPKNFVVFRPRKNTVIVEPRLVQSEEVQAELEGTSLDLMDYDKKWGRYRIRLTRDDLKKDKTFLTSLLERAWRAGEG